MRRVVPEFGGFISDHQVLDFNVLDSVCSSDDGSTDQRREDVSREVGARVAALDEARPVVADDHLAAVAVHFK